MLNAAALKVRIVSGSHKLGQCYGFSIFLSFNHSLTNWIASFLLPPMFCHLSFELNCNAYWIKLLEIVYFYSSDIDKTKSSLWNNKKEMFNCRPIVPVALNTLGSRGVPGDNALRLCQGPLLVVFGQMTKTCKPGGIYSGFSHISRLSLCLSLLKYLCFPYLCYFYLLQLTWCLELFAWKFTFSCRAKLSHYL